MSPSLKSKTKSTSKKNSKKSKSSKFSESEKILCYQGPHIYEAKCLKVKKHGQINKYLVHYRGWKSKYDEWVTQERILKFNKENLKLQQELRQKSKECFKKINNENKKSIEKAEKLGKLKKINSTNDNSNNTVSSALKKINSKNIETPLFVEKQEDFLTKREVKIRIPEDLKTILTDDWELITTQNKLLHLPCKLNIDKILNDYFVNKTQSSKLPAIHSINGYIDFLSGIRKYFNFFLDKCLLYTAEKQQLEYLIKNYDDLTSYMNSEQESNSNKDSKRTWKKHKKINNKKIDLSSKLSSVLNDEIVKSELISTNISKPISSDINCPSETSDSCTSGETNSSNQTYSLTKTNDNSPSKRIISESGFFKSKKVDYTKLYGAVHLLRLFTKLGQFLFYTDLNIERLTLLNSYINDFLKYLSKNLWLFGNDSDTSYGDASLLNVNK